jgi:putative ABC transport system permease protein
VEIEGRPTPPGQADPTPELRAVTGDYFRALSLAIASGRALGPADAEGTLPVGVVNEAAARRVFAGLDPVGRRLRFKDGPWITIVGVARDVPSMGLGRPAPPELFIPHEQLPAVRKSTIRVMYVVLRTAGDPLALAAAARSTVRELDPLLALIGVNRFTDLIHRSVAQPRFTMLLLGAFGVVALVLAAVGIYGLLSYTVKRRTREIGIRIALGGPPRHVLWLVVGQGMRLVLVGLLVGVAAAVAATRLMAGLLYGVSATDPLTFAGIVGLLVVVSLAASWLPARRAVRTDPRGALGSE